MCLTADFLGRATIAMNELKRLPSSRQIIPLTGKPGTTTTSGSITVEVSYLLFLSQFCPLLKCICLGIAFRI